MIWEFTLMLAWYWYMFSFKLFSCNFWLIYIYIFNDLDSQLSNYSPQSPQVQTIKVRDHKCLVQLNHFLLFLTKFTDYNFVNEIFIIQRKWWQQNWIKFEFNLIILNLKILVLCVISDMCRSHRKSENFVSKTPYTLHISFTAFFWGVATLHDISKNGAAREKNTQLKNFRILLFHQSKICFAHLF